MGFLLLLDRKPLLRSLLKVNNRLQPIALSLTSGLDPAQTGNVQPYQVALQAKALAEPGAKFAYGPNSFQVFGEVLRRKLEPKKQGVMEYLKSRLLEPITLKADRWRTGSDGNPNLPSGAFLTAREWAKYGEFLRLGGVAQGKQVVAQSLLAECMKSCPVNPAYGMSFWLNKPVSAALGSALADGGVGGFRRARRRTETPAQSAPSSIYAPSGDDMLMAAGAGKQRLYVLPQHKLVIARFGESGGPYRDDAFLEHLIVRASR